MNGLTIEVLSQACRIFLGLSYPEGQSSIPPSRQRFLAIGPHLELPFLLEARDVCEKLVALDGRDRGYALRLGSAGFPHLKLQAIHHDQGAAWLFAVDTHDALRITVSPSEAAAWAELQAENRRLKERIERAWESQGLLTFNALLRQWVDKK
jgi:hypothetical protein